MSAIRAGSIVRPRQSLLGKDMAGDWFGYVEMSRVFCDGDEDDIASLALLIIDIRHNEKNIVTIVLTDGSRTFETYISVHTSLDAVFERLA